MSEPKYPDAYRRCGKCGAYIGARCTALKSAIVGGQPVGPPAVLDHPHAGRVVRAGW